MNFQEYLPTVVKRAKPFDDATQAKHGCLGMLTELGELADNIKRNLVKGIPLDLINGQEEIGDFIWYLTLWAHTQGFAGWELDTYANESAKVGATPVDEVLLLGALAAALFVPEVHRDDNETMLKMVFGSLNGLIFRFEGNLPAILFANDAKLEKRHGGSFNAEGSTNRDTVAERAILEKSLRDHPSTNS